ncbi:hypothetical protein LZ575_04000 [Antarcticibacterium sp. 1MA-6-2]|uniref:hypothetical protein n=1 Tax=Antarcticibacterium sp. 1MA-6-2 TaxID=2908210 RepID=UPI001F44931A|nr:hypothetical protein [Antarcticibacterium sp. 1MA-6-2]UJH91831.1 hypothetical protein LZ575_04000 [Antarcticibacterium sp. 1MA-6-2]
MENSFEPNERIRSFVLENYNIATSYPDPDYDQLVFLTAAICKAPVAYLSIIEPDTICLKARYGIELEKLKRKKVLPRPLLIRGKVF